MIGVRASLLYSALVASAALVRAHGSVSGVAANGKEYGAPFPGSGPDSDSPVRVISTLEPIPSPDDGAMTCGRGSADSAKAIAEVTAGTDFTFSWRSGESNINWPHKLGPVMLYAYKCPGPANECKPSADDKGWALIDAAGYDVQRNGDLWVQERFFNGESVPAPVPAGMPDGDYLFRHEIIALHRIPCEFYVSCTQVRVVGGASANMSLADAGAELVSFPGAYSGNDAGLTANVFGGVNKDTYQMPGPKLFNPSKASTPPPETSDPEPTSTENEGSEPTATSTEEASSEPTSPVPSPTLTEEEPTATPTQCKMTRKQRRELRKARKARREMRKRAIAGREAHQRHKAALAAFRR